MIVLDASAAIEVVLNTERGRRIAARIFASGETLLAPHLIDVEVAQVLRRLAASAAVSPDRAGEALEDLAALPIDRYPHDVLLPRIWQLRHNVTAYDAAYLALAEALDAPLLTCDRRLAAAPDHTARVEVY